MRKKSNVLTLTKETLRLLSTDKWIAGAAGIPLIAYTLDPRKPCYYAVTPVTIDAHCTVPPPAPSGGAGGVGAGIPDVGPCAAPVEPASTVQSDFTIGCAME